MIKLSIILPVYQVEIYIRPCMESIFRQGLDDECFELIIVNDGTKDRSMEVIEDIISQHANITVINQENQGLSVARNNGIAVAKGEYILMPDSDDLLIDYSLKPLLDKAIETQADMIIADFLTMTDEEISRIQDIPQKDFNIREKTGRQLFVEDLNPHECFVWRTLYRKVFLTKANISFYPGIRYQDVPFTHECYIKANKCLRISWLLNIYRKWPGASTASFSLNHAKDFCMATVLTWRLQQFNLTSTEVLKLREDVWTSFSETMRLTCHQIKSSSERMMVIDYIREQAPDLNFHHGIMQQLVTFLYRNMPHTFIRLRYLYANIIEDRVLPFYYHIIRKIR